MTVTTEAPREISCSFDGTRAVDAVFPRAADLLLLPNALSSVQRAAGWVCRRRCVPEEVDDVVQEMVLFILQSGVSAQGNRAPATQDAYARLAEAIRRAANKVLDRLRTEARRDSRRVPLNFDPADRADKTAYWREIEERFDEVRVHLGALKDPTETEVLKLHFLRGWPITRIAREMGLDPRPLYAAVKRVVQQMQERFGEPVK